ncbi:GntR family transcriptional regulator [Chelatococcus sambhunathii]|uniref:GntR family transcriptional regulator n=1 Tax=Chelatococcus sambhunathii TaxID=363953 RepID=A0ABU1DBG2_9HYPH|nr:GntR family transcriptional regulator [Chelatococcus sambhunathii]
MLQVISGSGQTLSSRLRLNADTARPNYLQLEQQIGDMILSGELAKGDTLPPSRKLAVELGLSRATIQKCYDSLRRAGLLSAHGRLGFIIEGGPDKIKPRMERLKGFTEEMRELGKSASSRVLQQAIVRDRSVASIFGVPSDSALLLLVRVRYSDGLAMSKETAWYDVSAAPGLADKDLSGSVYQLLGEQGVGLVHCEQTIEASEPDEEECDIFGFEEPRPCLLIKRRSYDKDERLIEYVEGMFRGDAYAYRLKLSV